MKISEARKYVYELMGGLPDNYDGRVYLPSELYKNVHDKADEQFLIRLGELMYHVLNRRKSK